MTPTFAGRVALVTGAAQGMGRAAAERLHGLGAAVVLADVLDDDVRGLSVTLGDRALAVAGDVTDRAQVVAAVGRAVAQFGRLDILINSAGVLHGTRFEQIPEAEWRRSLDVNLTGVFLTTQAAAPAMRRSGYGRVVNISSTAGKSVSTLGGAHYTASKAGVLGLTRAAAKELAPHGITVNAVCPGLIDTGMARSIASQGELQQFASTFPIKRLGHPKEVAALICFLASDEAAYITGAAVDINGGDLML